MSEKVPLTSVIIPVFNGGDFLVACLDAIFASHYRVFEVIVVDDCSTDNSKEICNSRDITVLSTSSQSGPATARNLGASIAIGEILIFIDADVVVKPETIGRMVESFNCRSEISAVFGSYDDEPAEKNFLSQYKNLQHHFIHQISNREASTFWSGLGAVRKTVFLEHGGFDCEKFKVPSIEDIDLGFRLKRAGHQILLDPRIQAKHLKKWELRSHLRTEIRSRAIPWSQLIIENDGMINDMNLRKSDRLSAFLVGLTILTLPFIYWRPIMVTVVFGLLLSIAYLNRQLLKFFVAKRGLLFALMTFPWQLLYFFYSGMVFVLCWLWYRIPRLIGPEANRGTRNN